MQTSLNGPSYGGAQGVLRKGLAIWVSFRVLNTNWIRNLTPSLDGLPNPIRDGPGSKRRILRGFVTHYHTERMNQGLNNELIVPIEQPPEM